MKKYKNPLDYCDVKMPSDSEKISKYSQGQNSIKHHLFTILCLKKTSTQKQSKQFVYNKSKKTHCMRLFNIYKMCV